MRLPARPASTFKDAPCDSPPPQVQRPWGPTLGNLFPSTISSFSAWGMPQTRKSTSLCYRGMGWWQDWDSVLLLLLLLLLLAQGRPARRTKTATGVPDFPSGRRKRATLADLPRPVKRTSRHLTNRIALRANWPCQVQLRRATTYCLLFLAIGSQAALERVSVSVAGSWKYQTRCTVGHRHSSRR
ncbi:uncharacterized protein IWZ02DRAFT_165079 [Phyllosticta citriasiana]|uniref:uncharacterized protein n=1 Tax=Phyllosticta citriasiana TaxID=595635 RepID=UPI0030FD2B43